MMTTIIMILFVLLLILAVPVGLTVAITSMLPSLFSESFTVSGVYVLRAMLGGVNSYPLLAIPMFVLSGIIMSKGGVSKKLFEVFTYFVGKRTAGVPCAVVITCLFFGAISGSAPATVAAVGSMTIPLMLEMGYDKKFCVALVATAGGLGVIIPPSIPFILYAQATGTSVSDMFLAGIIPGILIGLILMCYAVFYCKKHGEDKEKINVMVDELHARGFRKVFFSSLFALLTPVIILGCIYTGVTSPTEAAVISVFYSLIISLVVYRTLKIRDLWGVFREAVRTYCPILFILAASVAFSRILTLMHVPQTVSAWMTGSFTNKIVLLLVVNLVLLVVGMVMDTSPAILILAPILLPIVETFGVDPVHFGIIMVVNLAIGFVTPPIGVNLFVASSLSDVPVMEIAKKAMPMIILFFVALLLVTYIPQISLLLV
ncbi:MAG: TRAP transporter large permease [Clostridiales bacterium]|nr:TRAP transporter large permease [Clostridiales bacterium]